MIGELGQQPRIGRGLLGQRFGELRVQAAAFPGQHRAVRGFAQQRVLEPVRAIVLVLDQDVLTEAFGERGVERPVVEPGDPGQHGVPDPAARDGGDLGQPGRVGAEPGEPFVHEVVQRGRDAGRPGAGLGDELFGEVGIALRQREVLVGALRADVLPGQRGDEGPEFLAAEGLQGQPARPADELRLGQPDPQRMPGAQSRPVAAHQHQPLVGLGEHEVGDEVERRGVGPVHVLEHQHQRFPAADVVEQPGDRAEDPAPRAGARSGAGARGEVGDQAGQLRPGGSGQFPGPLLAFGADQAAQGLGQRAVRDAVACQFETAAREDERAGFACGAGEFPQQARFSGACFAVEDEGFGVPGCCGGEHFAQQLEFGVSSEERVHAGPPSVVACSGERLGRGFERHRPRVAAWAIPRPPCGVRPRRRRSGTHSGARAVPLRDRPRGSRSPAVRRGGR